MKYEDTLAGTREIRRFDMVILNGNLRPSLASKPAPASRPELDGEGFVAPASVSCGFVMEPADVTESAIQAASAALRTITGKN